MNLRSLLAQLILSFISLVLLTAAAAGLPAIWLLHHQLERQAWAQVEQGQRAARTLYEAQQNELTSLAMLTAQRPTLHDLLAQGQGEPLQTYLGTLQASAGLDAVLICNAQDRAIAQTGQPMPHITCSMTTPSWFQVVSTDELSRIWLFAAHSLDGQGTPAQEKVLVGLVLDNQFAVAMRDQTGLEHRLLVGGQPVATSLALDALSCVTSRPRPLRDAVQTEFSLNGCPYYALRFALPSSETTPLDSAPELEAEVVLAVSDLAATQRSLLWTLIGSIVAVAALGSVLGTLLARRISRPLARLTKAATDLSQGDLDASMAIKADVTEVALVAQALERARVDLLQTLTELRQEKAWTDHLLEAIVEGIMTLDRYGRITFFSSGAERITGWSRTEVVGQSCDTIFRPLETDKPFSHFIPPPDRRHKVTVELADGHQATLSVTGARLVPPETGDAQVALVFRDVSEEEVVHRLMGHFLANIAHEFRTPLSALAASVELLLDQAPDLNSDELQELLTSLHLGILGLQTLVDNLLESASIEAGRFRVHPRPTQLSKILAETVRVMQPLLSKRGQRLVVELPAAIPVVRADPRRTEQVLTNLLSNASKYGPDEAEIVIGARVTGPWVRVTVADQGPGVLPEYRNSLFRRFIYPESGGDKAQYGAGLGLSVVKAVVEAHGGAVGLEDRPGGGSVFWFTLPVEVEQ